MQIIVQDKNSDGTLMQGMLVLSSVFRHAHTYNTQQESHTDVRGSPPNLLRTQDFLKCICSTLRY